MEVYIDNKFIKSIKAKHYVDHLAKSFKILKDYKMKLNLTKCAFEVSTWKFLGFIVKNRGIEANADKIRVVLDMRPSSNTKEVQRLIERIASLSRFVFRSSDNCHPFFQIMKKAFQWDAHCDKVFIVLKTYLSSPPILVSPSKRELLMLYLSISDFLTSAALVRDQDRTQQSVYCCNRALRRAEERYPKMENLVLALVTTARRLRPYFQAHTIEILTEHQMKKILHKPETSGRLVKWTIELSEFNIRYKPRIVTLYPRGPVDNPSTYGNLWISGNLTLHHYVPFIRIHNLKKKSDKVSSIRKALSKIQPV